MRFPLDLRVRKHGTRIRPHVDRLLRKMFPQVRLWWDKRKSVWFMVQVDPWPPVPITVLKGEPTIDNTVLWLIRASEHWNTGRSGLDKLVASLDGGEERRVEYGEKRAQELRAEGRKMMLDLLTGKIVMPVGEAHGPVRLPHHKTATWPPR